MPEEPKTCNNTGQPCKEITELRIKVQHLEEQQQTTTKKVGDLEGNVREILEFQGGTKVYVVEIKEQISTLENRLFTFMNDLVKNLTKKDEAGDNTAAIEREKNMDRWMQLIKFVLAGTILAIVAYIFKLK